MLPRPARPRSLSKRRARRRRRASPPNLLRGGGEKATCGKAPRPPVRAGGAGQEGPFARGGAPGGGAQVALATAPGPARLAPSSRSADNSASNLPQPTPLTPLPPTVALGPPRPRSDGRCGERATTAAGHRSSDERGLRELRGAVGCYPVPPTRPHSAKRAHRAFVFAPAPAATAEVAPTNLPSETAYHARHHGRAGVVTGTGGGVVTNPTA